jgi:hypothetical protein
MVGYQSFILRKCSGHHLVFNQSVISLGREAEESWLQFNIGYLN